MTQKNGLRLLAILAALTLSACGTTPNSPPPGVVELPPQVETPIEPDTKPVIDEAVGLVPPHMAGRQMSRVAILLPFSSDNATARAESLRLLRAAELALFERAGSNLLLIPKDTQGTAEGARAAAMAAFEDGADMIIGPLFGQSVTVVGQVARRANIPVIAFSTDTSTAGNGVYLLSFPPELEVARVVEYASRQGVQRYAYLGPQSRYGMTVHDALRDSAELTGGSLTTEAFYTGDVEAMASAASRLARGVFQPITPDEANVLRQSDWVPDPNAPFQAVMLPEGSTRLRTLGPLLISQAVDPLVVRFLGTGLWNDEDLLREPALHGGWFAGPDRASHERFEQSYEAAYGSEASNIASLGYDALALAAHLEGGELGFSREAIEDPEGYLGVDGLFRFAHSGLIERGLAIYEVQSRSFREVEPAPLTFDPLAY
ncbi:penicillin-binding protein activator [uncultured Maricaulis sp.]|uniref:penicillin-binding protein activator n=1 Tax=uncultured Maricaulis sp. TaxID=174710 RepID=UPI0030DA1C1B